MGAVLDEVLSLLLRDLAATGGPGARVDWEPWAEPERDSAALYGVDGAGVGVAVTVGADRQSQLVELAEQVSEWAVEALWHQQRPATWPPCPRHPGFHPLTARRVNDRAQWVCGSDDVVIALSGRWTGPEVGPRCRGQGLLPFVDDRWVGAAVLVVADGGQRR